MKFEVYIFQLIYKSSQPQSWLHDMCSNTVRQNAKELRWPTGDTCSNWKEAYREKEAVHRHCNGKGTNNGLNLKHNLLFCSHTIAPLPWYHSLVSLHPIGAELLPWPVEVPSLKVNVNSATPSRQMRLNHESTRIVNRVYIFLSTGGDLRTRSYKQKRIEHVDFQSSLMMTLHHFIAPHGQSWCSPRSARALAIESTRV